MPETCYRCDREALHRCTNCGEDICHLHSREKVAVVSSTSGRQQTIKLCCNCFYFGVNLSRFPIREMARA